MHRPALIPTLALVVAVLLAPATAAANAAYDGSVRPTPPTSGTRPSGKRPVPDFDGRPPPPATVGDVALWVPRVVLFLPWAIYEFGLRRPIGWTVTKAEQSRGARRVFRKFFLGKGTGPFITPIAYYDFGFQPSVGLRLLWSTGFLGHGSGLYVKLATWGRDWLRADFQEKVPLGGRTRAIIDAEFWRKPDRLFFGLGPSSSEEGGRYRADAVNVNLAVDTRLVRQLHVAPYAGLRSREFDADGCCNETLAERVAAGDIEALPPGFDGYLIAATGVELRADPRAGGRGSGSAVLAELSLEHAAEVADPARRWWRYGGRLGGVVHLDDIDEKVIDGWIFLEFADPVGATEIPFSELAGLGGSHDLRGFPSGRLVDRSAVAATLRYRWPLAAWLDTTLYLGAGNVFGRHLDGFAPGLLRGSAGLGLSLAGLWETRAVQLWTAIGTETWDDGFAPSSFRLVLGWAHEP